MKKFVIFFCVCLLTAAFLAACATPSARQTPVTTEATAPAEEPENTPKEEDALPVKESPIKTVRVQLADNQKEAFIKHSGRVFVYTQDLEKKYKISSAGTVSARALSGGKIQVGSLQSAQPIILEPDTDTLLTWNNNLYAGKIMVVPAQHTFLLVEHVDLENYLYGVLPYEMSYSWPLEALKAQAVAARTYTLKTLENSKNKYFDLYSDVRSQMYKGGGKQYDSVRTAVDATKHQVLTYNDKLFYTYYHGNCGAGTDSVNTWNPGSKVIKPLAGTTCPYDSHSKNFSWKTELSPTKIMNYMKDFGLTGTLQSVKVAGRTPSGRVTHLTVRSSKGEKRVVCNKFRLSLGLKSCKISRITVSNNKALFEGRGYGHGIGMCQDGAYGMAKAGKNYEQILKKYYPGAQLTTLK